MADGTRRIREIQESGVDISCKVRKYTRILCSTRDHRGDIALTKISRNVLVEEYQNYHEVQW